MTYHNPSHSIQTDAAVTPNLGSSLLLVCTQDLKAVRHVCVDVGRSAFKPRYVVVSLTGHDMSRGHIPHIYTSHRRPSWCH